MTDAPQSRYAQVTVLVTPQNYRYLQRRELQAKASFANTIDRSLDLAAFLDDQQSRGGQLLVARDGVHYPLILPE
jgi:hypothetical protein